jgi:hypothetical protein
VTDTLNSGFVSTNPETRLMQTIKERWGTAIEEATAPSSVQPSFLAALIANESGGKNDAQRFEPAVFERLKEVLLGQKPHYAPAGVKRPLEATDLTAYCAPGVGEERGDFAVELQCLHNLATSWGLTQIMGWHLVEFQSGFGTGWLASPGGNLNFATRLLAWFAEHYDLDLAGEFEKLLACWNTGEPMGATFDPHYIPNGMARKALYEELP